jgi:hypothetical protein
MRRIWNVLLWVPWTIGQLIQSPFRTMGRLMLWLSAANIQVLERFPSDRAKYIGLGSSIFITSSMAGLSASFALRLGLHLHLAACVVFGVLWGCAIMGFDRWLVATASRGWGLFLLLPRLILAVLIGLVISTPFVLQIFHPEIKNEIAVLHAERKAAFAVQIKDDQRTAQIKGLKDQITTLEGDLVDPGFNPEDDLHVKDMKAALGTAQTAFDVAQKAFLCETEGGTGCTGGVGGTGKSGYGPVATQLKTDLDARTTDLRIAKENYTKAIGDATTAHETARRTIVANANDKLPGLRKQVTDLQGQVDADVRQHDADTTKDTGLLIQIEALSELDKRRPSIQRAHHLLFAFITAIECLPILFKFLMSLGRRTRYEEGLEIEERENLLLSRQQSRLVRENAVRGAQAARVERDEAIEKLAVRTVRDQTEITEAALDRWKEEQLRRVEDDPTEFLNTDPSAQPPVQPPYSNGDSPREWPPRRRANPPRRQTDSRRGTSRRRNTTGERRRADDQWRWAPQRRGPDADDSAPDGAS